MRCPSCSQDDFRADAICAKCGFGGAPRQVEELAHIVYLLGELETWREISPPRRTQLRTRYLNRRQELEISLGLRSPPLSSHEIAGLQWEIYCLEQLQRGVDHWLEQGWVRPWPAGRLRQGAGTRIDRLRHRVADVPNLATSSHDSTQERLKLLDYLQQNLALVHQRKHFVDDEAYAAALAELQANRRSLEIKAGLRPAEPELAAEPVAGVMAAASAPSAPATDKRAAPTRPPREPITWDRIWQTLLSERTLNVLLFLGAFLLIASATTYVVYNWEALPPVIQLAFIVLFTLSFYVAGWFLRVRMRLRLSGIAITAVGSLLVPLDFYAILIEGGVWPADAWPWAWLLASAVCLPLYTFTVLRIRAQFFGYLVAVAAGSLVCATLQVASVDPQWWLAALTALALALAALAYRLGAVDSAWSILSNSFRLSALVTTSVILPLGFGWWVAGDKLGLDYEVSLAVAWALGAILYTYAAVRERSPLLGRAAATALPVALFLLLRLAFQSLGIEGAWYALGWALLAPVYLWAGHRFHTRAQAAAQDAVEQPPLSEEPVPDPVQRAHSHTATAWGLALMAVAAVWSIFDLWAAAATYAALAAGVTLAIYLWERPRALPFVSLFASSSITFAMAAGHLEPAELCLGWALLALLHVIAALRLQSAPDYAARLYAAALVLAAIAILPPLVVGHEPLLTYVLGQWIALAGWLLWLDHSGQHPGLRDLLARFGPLRRSVLHWAVALPLPFFVAMVYTRFRAPDAWLGLLMALFAWACCATGQLRLVTDGGRGHRSLSLVLGHWSSPWYLVGYASSLAAPLLAFYYYDQPLLGMTVLAASALYFASAWAFGADQWLIPAGLALPLGLLVLLDAWGLTVAQQSLALALVTATYLLGGIWLERRRGVAPGFMASLYAVAHLVALTAVVWGLAPGMEHILSDRPWPDAARLWAAGGLLVLGLSYGLFAWYREEERWAHVAAWLGVLSGGLIAVAYSQGRGSSAFKAALMAAIYVLAERALAGGWVQRHWPLAGRAWLLYRRPLLVAGWSVSAGAIGLALFRNLVILGGGFVREVWAIAGLLAVTALYAAAAWLFRRRLFVWLAAVLIVAPWTLLTAWGWFLWLAPAQLPRYALSWSILACLQLALGLALTFIHAHRSVPRTERESQSLDYGFPLRVIANLLLPFALFWGVADPDTSSITWGLGVAFYLASAVADHRRGLAGWRGAAFLYPTVAALPVWAVYLLYRFWPASPYEWYGLLLLALTLPLLAVGRLLQRRERADALPFYLGAYGVAIVGTLLVAHQRPLLATALTFDALLCVLSAWLFREALWAYPAAALAASAMLVALAESQVPSDRRGWWLIGLGAVYAGLAWLLRRGRGRERHPTADLDPGDRRQTPLQAYATPPLVMAFVLIALGLPPSSLDKVGAFWAYLAAALIYAALAAWLRQPLLTVATAGLLAVPYGVALVWLDVDRANYGLALFPGVIAALVLAHLLDGRLGRPEALFPSRDPKSWRLAALLDWWAAPWYAWGYTGALVAVGLTLRLTPERTYLLLAEMWLESMRLAAALVLAACAFLHATSRFRSRAALLLGGALAQMAALAVIDAYRAYGLFIYASQAALAFLPVTLLTAALALAVQSRRGEGSPLSTAWFQGWSRPLYLLLAVDLLLGQAAALRGSEPGAVVTTAHALLLALLATIWLQPLLAYTAVGLGIAGLVQAMTWSGAEFLTYPVGLALLALGYGLLAYGLAYAGKSDRTKIWLKPLEWTALGLSAVALLWAVQPGLAVADLLVQRLLGRGVTFATFAPQVRIVMWVWAITGLLYLATAWRRRWYVLGYGAVALLLGSWALWWRFFLDMAGFQWYAIPAGLYLLGVGWLEWRQGHRTLARWIDRAGMLVWLGTAWWQSLPGIMPNGWPYAIVMGIESLLLIWWGSARRQKRFLYVGAAGVVLNAVTQSIEPLLSANRWVVFGVAGLLLVGLAILVERRLEAIRGLSLELRERLEGWE